MATDDDRVAIATERIGRALGRVLVDARDTERALGVAEFSVAVRAAAAQLLLIACSFDAAVGGPDVAQLQDDVRDIGEFAALVAPEFLAVLAEAEARAEIGINVI